MSVGQQNWAWVCSPTAGVARSVLLALAGHANDDDVAFPSVNTLAVFSGFKERAVQKALREMVDDGVLTPLPTYRREMRKRGAHTTPYRLELGLCTWHGAPPDDVSWANKCTHRGVHVMHPQAIRGCTTCTPGVHEVHPRGACGAPDLPMELPTEDLSPDVGELTTRASVDDAVDTPAESGHDVAGRYASAPTAAQLRAIAKTAREEARQHRPGPGLLEHAPALAGQGAGRGA